MANLIEMSEQLKAVPDQWLEQQIQSPSGMVPPYLMLSELNRRKSLRSKMAQAPTSTVAQDVVGAQPPAGASPAPPGMATPDMLANQQPQPQLPQTPTPGLPNPSGGGLAAMAPPKPMVPPAPQRMAGGGLVSGEVATVAGLPAPTAAQRGEWFDDPDQPWWKRGLGMYGMSGGMMGLAPAILAGIFARHGKKDDGLTPASVTTTSTAPPALAEGGPVRLRAGGDYFSSMKLPYNYGTSVLSAKNPDDFEIVLDEFGNQVAMKGGRKLATFRPQAKFEFPEYRDTVPKTVKRPELSEMLAEIQKVTARPDTGPTAVEKRMAALEAERDRIRKPFWGDALTELGLGIMASKSPTALGAVGEAGMGALGSWRQQQREADKQRLAIEDRLLGVEAQREEQAERNRRADLQLADALAGREHGASVTEAQLESAREAQRARYELAKAEAAHQAAQAGITQENALQRVMLEQGLKDPRNIDPNSPEAIRNRLESEKELVEHRAKMEARYRKPDGSYGGLGRLFTQPSFVNNLAREALAGEYSKWDVGGGDTVDTFLGRVQQGLPDKIASGEIDHPLFHVDPRLRYMVSSAAAGLRFDPKKDSTFLGPIKAYVNAGKTGKPATSTGPQQVGGERQEGDITGSGSGSGATSSATPKAVLPRGISSRGAHDPRLAPPPAPPVPGLEKSRLPSGYGSRGGSGPAALPGTYAAPGGGSRGSSPIAYLRPEEEEEYLRNLELMGYAGRYA